jgi:hypothetical protein
LIYYCIKGQIQSDYGVTALVLHYRENDREDKFVDMQLSCVDKGKKDKFAQVL